MRKLLIRSRGPAVAAAALSLFAIEAMPSCTSRKDAGNDTASPQTTTQAVDAKYNWLQFGGDSTHRSNNTFETTVTPQNVNGLKQLFAINLPETIEGAPVFLTNVATNSGTHDLAFMTTRSGYILAIDAYTGATIWSAQPSSANITMSSPAIDPSLNYVYSAGLDGFIHKYAVGTGAEVTTGGWPELSTLKTNVEKDGTAITIGAFNGTNYLYMGVGGYDGDGGEYQGHVTTINLGTGAQTVFNAMCSNQTVHFTLGGNPDCANGQKSGIWAKAGLTFDPATNRLYVGTGNGTYNPPSFMWGDTILALSPDGTGKNGGPLDSYTPTNFQQLQNSDLDLGSTNVLILANNGSKYPHLAALSGKDAMLRLVNLDNMSGQGAAGKVGGEISSTPLQTGGEVQNPSATWINPADNTTWIFVVSPAKGMNAAKLVVDGSGNPSLVSVWSKTGGGGGAFVANNVLYYASDNNLKALDPTTGTQLWNNTGVGKIHWQAPVLVNGVLYLGDNGRKLTAFGLGSSVDAGAPDSGNGETALSRAGWVPSASNVAGGDVPANAIDGDSATRWSTGAAMANGMSFTVDMQTAHAFDTITMDAAGSANDYPRGYQVFVSNDGTNFGNAVSTGTGTGQVVTAQFAAQNARYFRIVQTGAASNWWSIAELNVYSSGSAPPPPVPPQPASGLTANATSASSIALTWTASPTSGVTYGVFRSTTPTFTPSAANQIASGLTTSAFTDTGLTASTVYDYYVEAINAGGASAPSNEGAATTQSACTNCTVVQINAAGPASPPFAADAFFTGGATINHADTINLSGVVSPAPQAVYQTARIGNFSYAIGGFAASSSHVVRLHFAETYFTTAGSRTFNVAINGAQVLSGFDIYAAAGAKDQALVREFTANASTTGAYVIQLTSIVNNSLLSGIEIQ